MINNIFRIKFFNYLQVKIFSIFTGLVLCSSFSYSQSILLKASFDTSAILIGDQIHLNIFIEQPPDTKIIFPLISDSLAGKIEILSASKIDTVFIGNGRIRLFQHYLITCFDSGIYKVPPFKFVFTSGPVKDTLATVPLVLTVNTIPIKDPKKIYDIKGIIPIPYTLAELLPYILIGLGIILLLALIIYIFIRLKQKKPIFAIQRPAEPPHIIAFRELEKLKTEKLWQQGHVKQYYTRLTDIIRSYIETRFNVLALESTSEEISIAMKNIDYVDSKSLNELKQLLETADLVKFAKAEPLPDDNENSWHYSYNFVINSFKDPVPEGQTEIVSEVNNI